jgi:mono/diheme cytochrome c family protein
MPNLPGLNPELGGKLLDYIAAQSATITGASAADAQKEKEEAEAKRTLYLVGRQLFLGKKSRDKNAPACLSCHELNGISKFPGGGFAHNLSFAFTDLNGRENALKWFIEPPTEVFKSEPLRSIHQLNEEEAGALVAYLEKAEDMPYEFNPWLKMRLAIASLITAAIIGYAIAFTNRKKSSK